VSRTFAPSSTDLHRAWLELVDTDGPFLAVSALKRVWPQGMPPPDADALAALKDAKPAWEKAWENWDKRRDDTAAVEFYRDARDVWVEVVLRDALGWGDSYVTITTENLSTGSEVRSPNHAVTVRPDGARPGRRPGRLAA